MRVLVTGASGLVGHHLLPLLLEQGHVPVALSRDPTQHSWPAGSETLAWDAKGRLPDVRADAVVNLVGERVIGRRWSRLQMQALRDSRIVPLERLAEWARQQPGPATLVSASAAGIYGIRPEGPCPETREAGDDFLAQLCSDWEATAHNFPGRVAILRFGHILSRQGGYLAQILPFARNCRFPGSH